MGALVQVFVDIAVNVGEADKIIIPVVFQDAVKVLIKTTLVRRKVDKRGNKPEQEEPEHIVCK